MCAALAVTFFSKLALQRYDAKRKEKELQNAFQALEDKEQEKTEEKAITHGASHMLELLLKDEPKNQKSETSTIQKETVQETILDKPLRETVSLLDSTSLTDSNGDDATPASSSHFSS